MRISVTFSLIITVISVTVSIAQQNIEEEFQNAFYRLDPNLDVLGGGPVSDWLNGFTSIAKCINDELGTLNICEFDTSYDPFYYLQKCAKGTLVQKVIETFVKSIPTTVSKIGIPPTVSKDRCPSLITSINPFSKILIS